MSESFTKQGVDEALERQLARDLWDIPEETRHTTMKRGQRGGITHQPKTLDPVLWMWWMFGPTYVRHWYWRGDSVQALALELRVEESLGSWQAALRQVYRWLGLNGFRRRGPGTCGLNHDPGDGGLPGNCVPRQRPKPK